MSEKNGWQLIRSATEVDSPLLDAATMDSKLSYAASLGSRKIDHVGLLIAGAGNVGGTIDANIWIGRGGEGPALLVAKATFELGTMQVNKDPQTHKTDHGLNYYVHKVTLTTKAWPFGVATGKDTEWGDDGNNRLGQFMFHLWNNDWIAVEITGLTNVTKANFYLTYISD